MTLSITVTVIQEKDGEEIHTGTIKTTTIPTVIQTTINITIMDIIIRTRITIIEHRMDMAMDIIMEGNKNCKTLRKIEFHVDKVKSSKHICDSDS